MSSRDFVIPSAALKAAMLAPKAARASIMFTNSVATSTFGAAINPCERCLNIAWLDSHNDLDDVRRKLILPGFAIGHFVELRGELEALALAPGEGFNEPVHVPSRSPDHEGWLLTVVDLGKSAPAGEAMDVVHAWLAWRARMRAAYRAAGPQAVQGFRTVLEAMMIWQLLQVGHVRRDLADILWLCRHLRWQASRGGSDGHLVAGRALDRRERHAARVEVPEVDDAVR